MINLHRLKICWLRSCWHARDQLKKKLLTRKGSTKWNCGDGENIYNMIFPLIFENACPEMYVSVTNTFHLGQIIYKGKGLWVVDCVCGLRSDWITILYQSTLQPPQPRHVNLHRVLAKAKKRQICGCPVHCIELFWCWLNPDGVPCHVLYQSVQTDNMSTYSRHKCCRQIALASQFMPANHPDKIKSNN